MPNNCSNPQMIADIGRVMADGLLERGVLPIIKHIPGHGRAVVDSHLELPQVSSSKTELRTVDFKPFADLAELPMAMTAHIVYGAYDAENPATQSKAVIEEVIRGEIGFDGLLMTDDLSMQALGGDFADRAQRSLQAGCDMVLYCNGAFEEMTAVAAAVPDLSGKAAERAARALDHLTLPCEYDRQAALASLDDLMAKSA